MAEKNFALGSPTKTFSVFLDIFYPSNLAVWDENGVFQQPLPFNLVDKVNARFGQLESSFIPNVLLQMLR